MNICLIIYDLYMYNEDVRFISCSCQKYRALKPSPLKSILKL